MVYGFVRQSGGHATLYSERGVGTTVRLYLPRRASPDLPHGAAAADDDSVRVAGAGENILLVEDGAEVRRLVGLQLTSLGYRVQAVENGAAALQVLHGETEVDLVLTDVMLTGGMDGVALSEAARQVRPGLGFLFMSGYAEGGNARDRIKARGESLLEKPFTIARLSAMVAKCLKAESEAR